MSLQDWLVGRFEKVKSMCGIEDEMRRDRDTYQVFDTCLLMSKGSAKTFSPAPWARLT